MDLLRHASNRWKVIHAIYARYGHARSCIEGYEQFITELVPSIIEENSLIRVDSKKRRIRHDVEFKGCTIFPPSLKEENGRVSRVTPHDARRRKLTYSVPVSTNITQTIRSYANVVGVTSALTLSNAGLNTPHDVAIVHGVISSCGSILNDDENSIRICKPFLDFRDMHVVCIGRLGAKGTISEIKAMYKFDSPKGKSLRNELIDLAVTKIIINKRVEVPLFKIPAMVKSSVCSLYQNTDSQQCPCDDGGYFIINGHEKVLVSQQKLRPNKIFCWKSKAGKYQYVAEVRSCHPTKWRSTSTIRIGLTRSHPPDIVVMVPFVMRGSTALECPLISIMKILVGDMDVDPKSILHGYNEKCNSIIDQNLLHAMASFSKSETIDWMGREGTKERTHERRNIYLGHIIKNEFLPHLGLSIDTEILFNKAIYVGFMVRRLLRAYIGDEPPDDRDHMSNRRLDSSGPLLAILFRQLYRNILKSLRAQLSKAIESQRKIGCIEDFINFGKLTSNIAYHFATGNWSLQKGKMPGVVQGLSNMSHFSRISHLRRTSTPMNREGKNPEPRLLKSSQYGLLCPSETPEGSGCGLILNLCFLTHITVAYKCDGYPSLLQSIGMIPFTISGAGVIVFLNGAIIGKTGFVDPLDMVQKLRCMRRSGSLHFETSIMIKENHGICIFLDPGRPIRPLYIRSELTKIRDVFKSRVFKGGNIFTELMANGCIEYLDKQEEESCACVATHVSQLQDYHTHIELDPTSLLGDCVSRIPFADFNQAPRNNYQANMGKQAIGIPFFTFPDAFYLPHMHVLAYSQKPLVTTQYDRMPRVKDLPAGQMPMVAIMCYRGNNQEDSLYFKQEAIDRGLFNSWYFRTHRDVLGGRGNDDEEFGRPPSNSIGCRASANYSTVDVENGLPTPETFVTSDDAIIGKYAHVTEFSPDRNSGSKNRCRCRSTFMRKGSTGFVDRIIETEDRDGKKMKIVRIRSYLKPQRGDKFSSRHGQKGTIGEKLRSVDMPFIESSGIVPDIIMNANAVPSRMTVGHLAETLLGKLCAIQGKTGDGTPFSGVCIDDIANELQKLGYDESGKEIMRCPRTGKRLVARVFVGPTMYQRLKHLAGQKLHTRSRGPLQTLVRQPQEGRTREGGLRVGEMENDCMQAHGVAFLQNDRMLLQSDPFKQYYCSACRLPADPPPSLRFGESISGNMPYCRNCKSYTTPKLVLLPYATKLCFQELLAMGIVPRVILQSLPKGNQAIRSIRSQLEERSKIKTEKRVDEIPEMFAFWDFLTYPEWDEEDIWFRRNSKKNPSIQHSYIMGPEQEPEKKIIGELDIISVPSSEYTCDIPGSPPYLSTGKTYAPPSPSYAPTSPPYQPMSLCEQNNSHEGSMPLDTFNVDFGYDAMPSFCPISPTSTPMITPISPRNFGN